MNKTEEKLLKNYVIIKRHGEVSSLIPNRYVEQSKVRDLLMKHYKLEKMELHHVYEIGSFSKEDFEI